jgi:hypothetical protein
MKHFGILGLVFVIPFIFAAASPAVPPPDILEPKGPPPSVAHVPFRLLFNAYDGDVTVKTNLAKLEFQVNTIDLRQPSEFLKLGDTISNTPWKLSNFVYKTRKNPQNGEEEDVSELTLTNVNTKQVVVLVLRQVLDVNAPAPKK